MTDRELLTRYVEDHDREALGAMIGRYMAMVHSAALRQCGDAHVADDVTQGVFLALVSKAKAIQPMESAAPWLLRATYLASREALRKQHRRERHERQAAGQRGEQMMGESKGWEAVGPELDGALQRLARPDRDAICLRYLAARPLAEVGRCLGVSEEAARKRVTRAIGRLRELLPGEVGATGLAALLEVHAVAGTGEHLISATLSTVAAPGAAARSVAAGIGRAMLITPGRVAAGVAAMLLVGGVVAAVAASRQGDAPPEPVQQAAATMPGTRPWTPPVLTSDIPSPLTLEGVLSKIEASRLQINRLHVRGKTRPQIRHAGSDAWQDTVEYETGELWLERFPQLRYRRYFPDRVTGWEAGAAPFLREESETVFDGTTGVQRSLAVAHHNGRQAGAWLAIPPQARTLNTATEQAQWMGVAGQESGLVLAPHLAPIREEGVDMIGRIRFAVAPPAQWAGKLRNLVEVVRENGRELVHVRGQAIDYFHEEYWFDPTHGWICVRQEDRRGPKSVLLYENHVDEVTGSGAAWYPKRGRQVCHSYEGVLLGGAFDRRWPGATDMQNVFEAELVEVNLPEFAEGTFDLRRIRSASGGDGRARQ